MIKNIIFDIGNVLTDFRWREFLQDKGFDEPTIKRIGEASIMSPIWSEFDRGAWTEEELMAAFVQNAPDLEKELHKAYDNITGMVTLRDYAIPWIKELKAKGYHVLYLSNFSLKAYIECADALAFLPYTDGGILSYREKMIKPDPEIYQLLLERFHLIPEECVFLDDTLQNIKAAQEAGIYGICFETQEQAQQQLKQLGVN